MDEAKLAEIEARANAATPGPWGADCAEGMRSVLSGGGLRALVVPWVSGALLSQGDSAFIAAARTDVPALVAEVRRLTAALATVTAERGEFLRSRDLADEYIACLRAEHAAALATARREGAEGMREAAIAVCNAIEDRIAASREGMRRSGTETLTAYQGRRARAVGQAHGAAICAMEIAELALPGDAPAQDTTRETDR